MPRSRLLYIVFGILAVQIRLSAAQEGNEVGFGCSLSARYQPSLYRWEKRTDLETSGGRVLFGFIGRYGLCGLRRIVASSYPLYLINYCMIMVLFNFDGYWSGSKTDVIYYPLTVIFIARKVTRSSGVYQETRGPGVLHFFRI